MFTQTGTVITQDITQAFSGSASYVVGDIVTFSGSVYRRADLSAVKGLGIDFTSVGAGFQQVQIANLPNIRGGLTRASSQKWDGSAWSATGSNTSESGKPVVDASGGLISISNAGTVAQAVADIAIAFERCGVLNSASFGEYTFSADDQQLLVFSDEDSDISDYALTTVVANWAATKTDPAPGLTDSGDPDVNPFWVLTTIDPLFDLLGREKFDQFADLAGVSYTKLGNRHIYTIASDTTFVNASTGTFSHDTEYSKIIVTAQVTNPTGGTCLFDIKGTYNHGVKKSGTTDSSSSTIYTNGEGLEFTGGFESNSADWFGTQANNTNGSHFGVSGTWNANGGPILGKIVFKPTTSATINNVAPAKIIVDSEGQVAGQEPLTRWTNPTVSVTDFAIEGGQISYNIPTVNVSIDKTAGGIAFWNQSLSNMDNTTPAGNYQVYVDCSVAENAVDFAAFTNSSITGARHSGSWFKNLESGSDLNVNGGELAAQKQNAGTYVLGTKEIETNITAIADGSNQKGLIIIKDTNRWSDLSDPIEEVAGNGVDYFDDDSQFSYRGVFDGDISTWTPTGGFAAGVLVASTSDNAVVQWTHQLNQSATLNRARSAQDAGIWKKDIRSNTATPGVDDFSIHVWSYENNYVLHPAILNGKGTYTINEALSVDPAVSATRANAVILEASAKGDGLSYTSSALTLTAAITLDELYDIIKLRKETDTADEALPTLGTLVIGGDGADIDLKALTQSFTGSGKLAAGTNHKSVSHDSTLSFDDFTLTNLQLNATALTLSGNTLTIPAGCRPVGTITRSTNLAITAANDADVSGLILAGSATYTLVGLPTSSYSASTTATTIDAFTHNVVIDTSSVSETTFYRVLVGSPLAVLADSSTFGSVSGATNSHTIALNSQTVTGLSLGANLLVVVTSADGVDVRHSTTQANTTDNLTINANSAYNSGGTASSGIAGSVDSPITEFTYTLDAGTSLGSADTNKTFNSIRSTQNYCDYISAVGLSGSIVNSSQNATQLDAATSVLSTVKDGDTTTAVSVQGLSLDTGAALSTVFTAGTFTGTGSIGLTLTADTAVDYAAVGSTVKAVVKDPMIKASKFIPLKNSDF